jgi:hypothetical protein
MCIEQQELAPARTHGSESTIETVMLAPNFMCRFSPGNSRSIGSETFIICTNIKNKEWNSVYLIFTWAWHLFCQGTWISVPEICHNACVNLYRICGLASVFIYWVSAAIGADKASQTNRRLTAVKLCQWVKELSKLNSLHWAGIFWD